MRRRARFKKALEAAGRMDLYLPGLVEALHERFHERGENGEWKASIRDQVRITSLFASSLALRPQIEAKLGVGRGASAASVANPLVAVFGGNVAVMKNLPAEERQALVLKALKGEKLPELPPPDEAK